MTSKIFKFALISLLTFSVYADDEDALKQGLLSSMSSGIASSIASVIGGQGDTEVQFSAKEDNKPQFTIMTVKPISVHPGKDAWFVQLQLSNTQIRSQSRLTTNIGLGYRTLSDNKKSMIGGNVFVDYDEEGNSRYSLGFEFRTTVFEILINHYEAISGQKTVGDFKERALDGNDMSINGQIPYLPWAKINLMHYEWKKINNSKNSKGDKLSLDLLLTPNVVLELGVDDNNIQKKDNFAKLSFVFPPREGPSASTDFIADEAFPGGDMSSQLLSKVKRSNKITLESEGVGVTISRLD
ncbi:inverse autotransporter beta domain-containing protein [Candidatus Thioglobus sp.]|nr:inverse autotransporter beta domain-containing protein [Candidatus Thioglobus sp.]